MITDVIAFISICLTSYLLSTLWRSWPIRSCCGKRKKEKKKRKLSNYKREKRQRCILYRCMDVYMASLQRGEKKKKVGIDLMPYRDTGEMQPGRGEWGGGVYVYCSMMLRVSCFWHLLPADVDVCFVVTLSRRSRYFGFAVIWFCFQEHETDRWVLHFVLQKIVNKQTNRKGQ